MRSFDPQGKVKWIEGRSGFKFISMHLIAFQKIHLRNQWI